eukprot:scaffold28427_cov21-Tisochrysis_lutea.AAC.1
MVSLYLCAGVRCVSAQLYANECGVIVLGAGGAQSWHAGLHPVPELLLLYVDDALGSGLLPNHDSLFGWEHMQPMSTCLYVKGGGLSRGTFKLQGRYELTKLCTLILAPGAEAKAAFNSGGHIVHWIFCELPQMTQIAGSPCDLDVCRD